MVTKLERRGFVDGLTGFSVKDTAVLVIDVQNDFCHPDGALGPKTGGEMDCNQIISTINKTLNSLREKSVDIIFIRTVHSRWTNSPNWTARKSNTKEMPVCIPDSWGADFCGVSPMQNELVVTKNRYSAFHGTNLDLILRSLGKRNLLLMGFMANVCVESTARDAFQLNYSVYALEDCIGAAGKKEFESAMLNIDKYFGQVIKVKNLFAALENGGTIG